MITVIGIHGSMSRLQSCLCNPTFANFSEYSSIKSLASNQRSFACFFGDLLKIFKHRGSSSTGINSNVSLSDNSSGACIPATFFPHQTGRAGLCCTLSLNFSFGIALDEALFLEL